MPSSDDIFAPRLPSPMTPREQLEALDRVQDQAEQRAQAGAELLLAAHVQTDEQRKLLDDLKTERDQLRQELHEDVARSLHAYDQWVGQIDESFTKGLRSLESKMDKLEDAWTASQQRIQTMLARSEAMLNQTRTMIKNLAPTGDESAAQSLNVAPEARSSTSSGEAA